MDWNDWIKHHAALYPKYAGDAGTATLTAWATVFADMGVPPDVMISASTGLAMSALPSWPEDQLRALRNEAVEWKKRQIEKADEAVARVPACDLCDHTGYVTVPTSTTMRGGAHWICAAVTCRCPLGKYLHAIKVDGRVAIDDYEEIFPDWQQAVAQHHQELLNWGKATAMSEGLGESIGKVLATVQARKDAHDREQKLRRTP